MSEPVKFSVRKPETGMTLLDFLAARLNISRRGAKRLLDQRCVFVNGRRVWMANHALAVGDAVEATPEKKQPASRQKSEMRGKKLVTLWEDDDYLVLNKPAGLASNGAGSVENLLVRQEGMETARVAHRLDRDTTGCLLCAKHSDAFGRAVTMFRQGAVKKQYLVIVSGMVRKAEFTITKPLDGRTAVTHLKRLDANDKAGLLLVDLETGRTHQIRRHLAAVGHSVLGEKQYRPGRDVPPQERKVARQMLHAYRLAFPQPFSGETVHCQAPLPRDFLTCLRTFHLNCDKGNL
ncbi:MAG: RluA family pseudouridine synthase [Phycisphaerae bacterium]|nr:RluA family pseudouridine synthase [Phycisphaerae bacterium]